MDITLERILSLLPHNDKGKPVHGSKTILARELGLPSNIFAEWVGGRNRSYHNYLYQIAAKYDVSVEWLKGETDEKTPPADAESERAKLLASLENMSKDELIDFVAKAMEVMKSK